MSREVPSAQEWPTGAMSREMLDRDPETRSESHGEVFNKPGSVPSPELRDTYDRETLERIAATAAPGSVYTGTDITDTMTAEFHQTGNAGQKHQVDIHRTAAGTFFTPKPNDDYFANARGEHLGKPCSPGGDDWYKQGGVEPVEFILGNELPTWKGNAIEYIFRAGKKAGNPEKQDIEKAIWWLQQRLDRL